MAPVAYLRIKRAELVEKDPVPTGTLKDSVAVPPLLDDEGECVEKAADSVRFPDGAPARPELQFVGDRPTATSEEHDGWISLASVTAQPTPYDIVSFSTLEDEVRACFERLADHLGYRTVPRHGSHIVKRGDLSHITHINLFLRSMSDFPAVNKVYSTFFGSSPPTRACVATHLPDHVRLMIDAIAQRPDKTKTRKALHVQGLSYWAPANIGPYSQAIEVSENSSGSGFSLITFCASRPLDDSSLLARLVSFQQLSNFPRRHPSQPKLPSRYNTSVAS